VADLPPVTIGDDVDDADAVPARFMLTPVGSRFNAGLKAGFPG